MALLGPRGYSSVAVLLFFVKIAALLIALLRCACGPLLVRAPYPTQVHAPPLSALPTSCLFRCPAPPSASTPALSP